MKRLLKLVAIATVAAAWNPFGRRKAQDATTTTTTTPGTCDASDEACAAAAEADALERLAALERAASVPAGAGRPSTAPQKWKAIAVSADGSRRVALASGGTFANDFKGAGLWTSRDGGATWQQKARDGNWRSVASDAAGDRLLACGGGRAGGCVEINHWFGGSPPNFRTLYQIDVDSANFWTYRLLSSSSRSTAENLASKRSHTRTLKSG